MAAGPAANSELPLPTTENHWDQVMGYIRGLETDFSDLTNHLRQMILECGSEEFPLLQQQQHILVDEMHENFADLRIAMENLESALDDDESGMLGGTESQINELPLVMHKSADPSNKYAESNHCAICQYDIKDGETIRILPCLHRFHAECIDPYLKQHFQCPICRTKCYDTDDHSMV